jgi:putative ABC transport system ATP-binding protein
MAKAIVKLTDLSKVYMMGEIEIHALNHIALEIEEGEFVAILGPSGSGKTTLLNMLGGLDTPATGQLIIGGEDIAGYNESKLTHFRRDKIGFIFQFFNLIPTLTARENVEFAIELTARDGDIVKRSAVELLDAVGLKDRANHFPFQLSGGEQQRVAVARALAKDPALILGDEPTGNLDFRMGKLVLKTLRELTDKEGKTCLIVTHNTPISRVADRILYLHDGAIAREEKNANPVSPDDVEW